MGSKKIRQTTIKIHPINVFSSNTFPSTASALFKSFCPIFTETSVDAPTPTNEPKAAARLINGKVTANPAIANGPTPCPIKILSIILYNEAAVIATIAGTAYFINNFRISSEPKVRGVCFNIKTILKNYKKNQACQPKSAHSSMSLRKASIASSSGTATRTI